MPLNLYKEIKSAVTTRAAAERYGLSVDRNGMALCPFHDDHNPSLKVSRGFHCFACGAQGDVITFTAMLLGINAGSAARKLAEDFGIVTNAPQTLDTKKGENWFSYARGVLHEYYDLLLLWKQSHRPQAPEEGWDDQFVEALQNQANIRELIRILEFGPAAEREEIHQLYGGKVTEIDDRIHNHDTTGGFQKPQQE